MASGTIRAALYARVSTRDGDQDPTNQLLTLRERAERNGWVTTEFIDEASGKDLNRPSWQKLMGLVRRGRFDIVIVTAIHRAFRSVSDGSVVLAELDALGVRFVPLRERAMDTGSPFGKAMIQMAMVWAELENSITRERIMAGLKRARAEGKHIGRPRLRLSVKRARSVILRHGGDEVLAANGDWGQQEHSETAVGGSLGGSQTWSVGDHWWPPSHPGYRPQKLSRCRRDRWCGIYRD